MESFNLAALSQNEVAFIWLAISALCFILEVALISGFGFLFAGFAALTVGGMINFGFLQSDATIPQLSFFFGLIFVWAGILYYPLKNFRNKGKENSYRNVIGDSATVISKTLEKNKHGQVKWSGTTMKAKLYSEDEKDSLNKDDNAYVQDIKGNTLIVTSDANNIKTEEE
jgi:membrane protein implicated in regulation of membrane protease activity